MIGKTISHYKILERIGGGGMGVVYKAEDLKLDRFVALKFLPPHLTTSDEEKQRFIHEAKAASALQHNNICTIHEIDETEDGQLFICMDYYEGVTLKSKIEQGQLLSADEILDIALQIANGLARAHESNIIHRDLKPANIMITDRGEVKIVDFGLAKLAGKSKLTKETTTLGTVAYMSPEQTEGSNVDHRTDIWSLGVVLYEMITGQVPFKGDYEKAIIYSIINEDPQQLTAMRSGVSMELEVVVNKCLEKNPSDRYQHVDDLIVDLRRLKRDSESKITSSRQEVGVDYPKKRVKAKIIPAIFLIIPIIIVAGYFFINRFVTTEVPESKTIADTQWKNSIAVLPFKNISADPDQEPFVDGITDQIITNLSKLEVLKVIGRTSVMQYKNTIKTIPEIGKELNVANILEGSASRFGNRIRVIVQLVETKEGTHLWADNYDYSYELDSILTIFDNASEKIANALIENLSTEEVADLKTEKPSNVEAYEYYMRGTYFHNKFWSATGSLDDFKTSENLFLKAIELDPNYALSYASLADLYNTYFNYVASTEADSNKYLDLQETYLNNALELNANLCYVQTVKAMVHSAKNERMAEYISTKKALQINQNDAFANYNAGVFLNHRGLFDASMRYITRAIEIDPLAPEYYRDRAANLSLLGEKYKAENDIKKALEINPDHLATLDLYIWLLISWRRYDEAENYLVKQEEIRSDSKSNRFYRALLYAVKGEKEKALELYQEGGYYIYAVLGMKDDAINDLNEWYNNRWSKIECSRYIALKISPFIDNLRTDPRFQEIMAKHKKLYEENLRRYGDLTDLIKE